MNKLNLLKEIRFGQRIAEDEINDLEKYFVETDHWNRLFSGEIDVVYGPKGSGKSAIYGLITKQQDRLFDRQILVKAAENVRGNTVFSDLVADPPPDERSFIFLWKLYLLTLTAYCLRDYGIREKKSDQLISALEKADLLPADGTLSVYFRRAKRLVWSYLFPERESVEWTLAIDPTTGYPFATRKTTFAPKSEEKQHTFDIPIDDLLELANEVLEVSNYDIWIVIDRLDVAFNDNPEIERNALRALFRSYIDLKGFHKICPKIFVRDDIWRRIAKGGFSEASHITKSIHITWAEEALFNLFIRRLLSNENLCQHLDIDKEYILDDYARQLAVGDRVFPDKVETGKNPKTFQWMINRVTDATGQPAPRELIHLLESMQREQIVRLERGEPEPEGEQLFERGIFKVALKEVSKVKFEQTLVAENPSIADYMWMLKGEKTEHTISTLAQKWSMDERDAVDIASQLVDVGFFEYRKSGRPHTYWVPFIYRDALEMVQGRAFSDEVVEE